MRVARTRERNAIVVGASPQSQAATEQMPRKFEVVDFANRRVKDELAIVVGKRKPLVA